MANGDSPRTKEPVQPWADSRSAAGSPSAPGGQT